jgi:hypothetical protein
MPSDPGKSENEGIQIESHSAHAKQAGLILLFDGEAAESVDGFWLMGKASAVSRSQPSTLNHQLKQPDEHSQTGILTSNLSLAPAFPVSA